MLVTTEAFPAIPTVENLSPVIVPSFVNVELFSPNIPVENFVAIFIFPLEVFVAVESFSAIPTKPSNVLVGDAVFNSIVPAFITVDLAFPNIPVDLFDIKFIVAPLLFSAVELSVAMPTAPTPFPFITPLLVNVDLSEPMANPNIPVESTPLKVIVPVLVAVEALVAIPTAFCLFPLIVPAFVNVDLTTPYIPVE